MIGSRPETCQNEGGDAEANHDQLRTGNNKDGRPVGVQLTRTETRLSEENSGHAVTAAAALRSSHEQLGPLVGRPDSRLSGGRGERPASASADDPRTTTDNHRRHQDGGGGPIASSRPESRMDRLASCAASSSSRPESRLYNELDIIGVNREMAGAAYSEVGTDSSGVSSGSGGGGGGGGDGGGSPSIAHRSAAAVVEDRSRLTWYHANMPR